MSTTQTPADPPDSAWVDQVLRFWFEELTQAQWFAKSDALDAQIRARFLSVHKQLTTGDTPAPSGPRATLAAVIVLDQFSRNMFRGEPRAFAADGIALQLAKQAVAQGLDRAMAPAERLFLYLPYEHSEDAADQALSLELTTALGNEFWTRYALAHKQIIDRFGRFPHRNAVLGRESTPEEIELLTGPMSSF